MEDWKLILKVVLGSVVLIMVIIFGLSRMSSTNTALKTDQDILLNGAKLVKENGETKVTVVSFSDMECPACKQAHELTKSLYDTPGVKMVFRQFPLKMHKYSSIAANAVDAAYEMGKGLEMIDLLFSKQNEWSSDPNIEIKMVEYAKLLGLNEVDFQSRLNSASTLAAVKADIALGDRLQLLGTPTFFVNGEQVAASFVTSRVMELLKQE